MYTSFTFTGYKKLRYLAIDFEMHFHTLILLVFNLQSFVVVQFWMGFNPSQQLSPTQSLTHTATSGMGQRIGRVRV